jgi:hypothetical protein
MRHFFTFILITIMSTPLHAKNIKHSNQAIDFQQTLPIEKVSMTKTSHTAVQSKNEANNLRLCLR